ncbi:MAG: hypothetical protein M3O70_00025 [Actinomycetota bacterium]|nr:hypothetical protein [Actinomycetota bacterium]
MATSGNAGGSGAKTAAPPDVLEQLVQLTQAIKDLAERTEPDPPDEDGAARRQRQRVDFGYRALGTLMGRSSRSADGEFDVPVFVARWGQHHDRILLGALPDGADWIELRSGDRVEVLEVTRLSGGSPAAKDQWSLKEPPQARIQPKDFSANEPIGSMVALRRRNGPLVAFGPRLKPTPHSPGLV